MPFVRKLLLGIISPLAWLLLFALAVDFSVTHIVGQPTKVKHLLAESGVYNSVISSALSQTKQQTSEAGDIALTDPAIKSAAEAAFSPQFLQTNVEKIIDGTYHWLNGKASQPDFRIDFSDAKATFADKVAQAAQQRAASLPVCTTAPTTTSFDAFNAPCLPKAVTPAQVAEQTRNTLTSGQGFLDTPVITAKDIKGSPNSNKSIFEDQLKQVPKQYQRAKEVPLILTILALLSLAGIVFLSSSLRLGLRHAGIILLLVGAFLGLFAWGLHKAVADKALTKINISDKVVQANVRSLITDISDDIEHSNYTLGGIYAAIGIVAIGGSMFMGRKARVVTTGGTEPAALAETAELSKPTRADKPAPKIEAKPPVKKAPRKIEIK